MTKFVRYTANFICFFLINVHLNASQISNDYNNQLLGTLYADYNNDFLSWKKLPQFEDYVDPSSLHMNQIITGEKFNFSDLNENFTLRLIDKLERLKNDDCSLLEIDSAYYIFEETLAKSINFWMKYCLKEDVQKQKIVIDQRFKNISLLNELYLGFLNNEIQVISDLYVKIANDEQLLRLFNSKELNLINKIFTSFEFEFPLEELTVNDTSLNNMTIKLDQDFQINNFKDLIFLQAYQTSIYYYYSRQYKQSLALMAYLSNNDLKNKSYYEYQLISFLAELNPNNESLKAIEDFIFTNTKFSFFKNYLYLKTATEFDIEINQLKNFFKQINFLGDWQTIELALLVAIEMYSHNLNTEALEFIENCCFDSINSSDDPLHLFKYGILLERNGKIKSSEKIIQKSLDISDNSYPYILNYLAYLWVDNNRNLDKAEKMLIKAVEDSNYEDGAIIDSLGWLYFKKDDLKLAEKWISDAYRLEPSEPEIIDHLSQIYLKLGRYKESKFLDNKILLFHKDYFKIDEIKERNENS